MNLLRAIGAGICLVLLGAGCIHQYTGTAISQEENNKKVNMRMCHEAVARFTEQLMEMEKIAGGMSYSTGVQSIIHQVTSIPCEDGKFHMVTSTMMYAEKGKIYTWAEFKK